MGTVRIGELADLAGMTVRAVRHYHRKGVLPEPARRSNGYREYDVEHLVTLLRLGHLTRSGLSLAQAGEVIADTGAAAEDVLDEVDEALRRRIAALTAQRDRLAEARAGHHLGLPRLAAALVTKPEDIPLSTLFAHLHTDEEQAQRMADVLQDPRTRPRILELQDRFDAVDEHTGADALEQLVADTRRLLEVLAEHVPEVTEQQSRLIIDLAERGLNPQQREVLRRLS
ncbi:MerR family transcriptional regulator [Brachybacterium paraconglomeratum]